MEVCQLGTEVWLIWRRLREWVVMLGDRQYCLPGIKNEIMLGSKFVCALVEIYIGLGMRGMKLRCWKRT